MPYSNKQSFLGQGWGFPAEFDEQTLSVAMVADEEDIRQSLFILFSTTPGERIMTPHYGCDLNSLVFEKIGDSLRAAIVAMVTKAIVLFEPMIPDWTMVAVVIVTILLMEFTKIKLGFFL